MPAAGKQQPKRKLCRNCRARFEPYNSLQAVCSAFCGLQYVKTPKGQAEIKKAQRRELRAFRADRETIGSLTKKAQASFNRYVRTRDEGKECISCGKPAGPVVYGGSRDASHYRSTGACPQLRFEPLNCHASCVRCNRDLSGNIVAYRRGLLARIGAAQLAWIESDHDQPRWRHEDLIEIRRKFDRLAKDLIKQREAAA